MWTELQFFLFLIRHQDIRSTERYELQLESDSIAIQQKLFIVKVSMMECMSEPRRLLREVFFLSLHLYRMLYAVCLNSLVIFDSICEKRDDLSCLVRHKSLLKKHFCSLALSWQGTNCWEFIFVGFCDYWYILRLLGELLIWFIYVYVCI